MQIGAIMLALVSFVHIFEEHNTASLASCMFSLFSNVRYFLL